MKNNFLNKIGIKYNDEYMLPVTKVKQNGETQLFVLDRIENMSYIFTHFGVRLG